MCVCDFVVVDDISQSPQVGDNRMIAIPPEIGNVQTLAELWVRACTLQEGRHLWLTHGKSWIGIVCAGFLLSSTACPQRRRSSYVFSLLFHNC
jgi:hypothetical protein